MPLRFQLENGREVPKRRVNSHHVFLGEGLVYTRRTKTFS